MEPSDALTAMAEKVRTAVNVGRANDIRTACQTANLIAATVTSKWILDHDAVEVLAQVCGQAINHFNLLYRLVQTYDEAFLAACLKRKTATGNLITLEHLFVLMAQASAQIRHELIEAFYERDLTVQAITELIMADREIYTTPKSRRSRPQDEDPIMVAVDVVRAMAKLEERMLSWRDRLLDKIRAKCANSSYTLLLRQLQQAKVGVSRNLDALTEMSQRLDEAIAFVQANIRAPQDLRQEDDDGPKDGGGA